MPDENPAPGIEAHLQDEENYWNIFLPWLVCEPFCPYKRILPFPSLASGPLISGDCGQALDFRQFFWCPNFLVTCADTILISFNKSSFHSWEIDVHSGICPHLLLQKKGRRGKKSLLIFLAMSSYSVNKLPLAAFRDPIGSCTDLLFLLCLEAALLFILASLAISLSFLTFGSLITLLHFLNFVTVISLAESLFDFSHSFSLS